VLKDPQTDFTLPFNNHQSFFIYQLMHKRIALKRILKFTLKQLLHVSMQSPSSGSAIFEHAKVIVVKIIN
jgi:hypothetical protein